MLFHFSFISPCTTGLKVKGSGRWERRCNK